MRLALRTSRATAAAGGRSGGRAVGPPRRALRSAARVRLAPRVADGRACRALGSARSRSPRRPRTGQLRPEAVHEPRRPARLFERDARARHRRGAAALGLRRERQLADPPVRDRRLHRLHALPGRDGSLLEARPRAGLALPRPRQRRRRGGDGDRGGDRDRDEVRGRRLDRHRRDPGARACVLRDPASLPRDRPAPACRRRRSRRSATATELDLASGRIDRRGDRGRALVYAGDERQRLPCDPRPQPRHRSGHQATLVPVCGRAVAPQGARRLARCHGGSPRAGLASAERRVELRHHRHPGAFSARLAPRGAQPSAGAAAEAPAAGRAGRRRGRRPRPRREGRGATGAGGRSGSRLRRECVVDACRQLRAHAWDQRHPGCQFRLQRGRGRGDAPGMGRARTSDPARGRRRPLPRHRHPPCAATSVA